MFEELKSNVSVMKELMQKVRNETKEDVRQACVDLITILNRGIPELMKKNSPVASENTTLQIVSVPYGTDKRTVFILPIDQRIYTTVVSRIAKKGRVVTKEAKKEEKKQKKAESETFSKVKPSLVRNVANKFFRNLSESTISNFKGMEKNVKAANMAILPSTYLAVAYLWTLLSFFGAILVYGALLYINLTMFWTYFWVIVVLPLVVFVLFIFYPQTEADRVKKNISYELPFATIHMTAIAGSNIEPSKMFGIIGTSKEYPNIGKEFQKVLVMIQVYGYDLVSSLKNVASRTSNTKLSELLGGIATNIAGGGELKNYLEKKSENYLLDYKLERKKYIDIASTFMDIYISILIAAPMILMLMFIIMNVSGIGFQGFSISFLMMVSIIGIAIVNVIFLVVLNLKQPKV